MSVKETKFDKWWNSPSVKRVVGVVYSLGAAVVILGAMFKILHLPGGSLVLGIGMSIEVFLFALGAFDKPHHEFAWDRVFDFTANTAMNLTLEKGIPVNGVTSSVSHAPKSGINYSESINDDDVQKLSEGIRNLSKTAEQLSALTSVAGSASQFAKSMDTASQTTLSFANNQEALNATAQKLNSSYQGITNGMSEVEHQTKAYASKVEDIYKNMASINTIYEIQLKNIQAQSEGINKQTDAVKMVTDELNQISNDIKKVRVSAATAAEETEKFKAGTSKLAQQVSDLNQVYGNMLNALN